MELRQTKKYVFKNWLLEDENAFVNIYEEKASLNNRLSLFKISSKEL